MPSDETPPIEIPDAVFEDFERVRASSLCNMLMLDDVIEVAESLDCVHLSTWIEDNCADRRSRRKAWPAMLTGFSAWKEAQHD